MNNLVINLEQETLDNEYFRKVLLTTSNQQLVVMSLNPTEEIGMEIHSLDQFIKIEKGQGRAILNGVEFSFEDGYSVSIPKGTSHNIINDSKSEPLKLYTVYSPPNHPEGTVHKTKQEAENAEKEELHTPSSMEQDFNL